MLMQIDVHLDFEKKIPFRIHQNTAYMPFQAKNSFFFSGKPIAAHDNDTVIVSVSLYVRQSHAAGIVSTL